ncbi:MAG: 4-hydroxybenzoate 3-monooxygenase [Alphaproteobacteria bacterium]|nr:4-hydroxybenzoate 3-monooxygenase [Alphaproteobacteria bacterium]MBU1517140.1 4-hydroxybenzoate 3-monooxygenase [Alphaproteobacteria bacterium]MBU2096527.1 4-hydroxybenzoate 3-monooxygenase [Alphaproteobacteria bacterium]MBU2151679.1 4-hydroxybenzoate 3-monooxygenase [Alphaproteobacteria bacterium]MBU2305443.1 4-hydroxybenzoate 3-monooxygenase [Alphaproteobacteria bacterium]
MRVQVAIIGAGPAGMVLGHLLHRAGVDLIVLEQRSRAYVEGRVRAGVLEHGTVQTLRDLGVGERLAAEGLVHDGVSLACDGDVLRIDLAALTGGRGVTVYGQQEVMRDVFDAAEARGLPVIFGCEDVALEGLDGAAATVRWGQDGAAQSVVCDFVAGCDGQHGVSRASVPPGVLVTHARSYPFAWLGILADVPPAAPELIYASHEDGFALASMRSATRSRYYLQCPLDTRIEDWPDGRFWDELERRLGPEAAAGVVRGPSFDKSLAPLRSTVTEPLRFGRLFLAGDAAHIVPPTGAKGMNLAVADVRRLAEALLAFYAEGGEGALDAYGPAALRRVWQAARFSWWFTGLTHRFPGADGFDRRLQRAEFDVLAGSRAAQMAFAEAYVGPAEV